MLPSPVTPSLVALLSGCRNDIALTMRAIGFPPFRAKPLMIYAERLHQLRFKGEGPDLDFKQSQYRFIGASDHETSELLKDILAIANAYRDGPGHILIDVRNQSPYAGSFETPSVTALG